MTSQIHVDPTEVLACRAASDAVYDVLDSPALPPITGYDPLKIFTGFDRAFGSDHVERYGVLYRSQADSDHYLIAFRGTDGVLDWYEDSFFEQVEFTPVSGDASQTVHICDGFHSVYTTSRGSELSMRDQVFKMVHDHRIRSLTITGHSLGAALANIFAYDLACSDSRVAIRNVTFASPRVGVRSWHDKYMANAALAGATVRVYNHHDIVPTVPAFPGMDFTHVGQPFQVNFKRKHHFLPHYGSRHSIANYGVVLEHALASPEQVWVGFFQDQTDTDKEMKSEAPVFGSHAEWSLIQHAIAVDPELAHVVTEMARKSLASRTCH